MVKLKSIILLVIIVALSGCMEDVIRVVDTYPLQYINASNITVIGASATSGELSNISDINGGYFNVSEGNAQPFYVIVNFTNITNFSFLEVKSKYFSISGTPSSHVVDLEIYCSTDNEYEDLFFLENANEWRYFTRHFPDSMHFIDAQGNVSIKFNHTANGNNNHRLYIDTVRLIIKESFEQNTVTLNQYFNTTNGTGTVNDSSLNLKVNKSGDTMTGSLFQNRSGLSVGSFSFVDLAGVGQPGRIISFFGINRIFNESTLAWSNSSYPSQNGMAAIFDSQNYNPSGTPPSMKLAYFLPNQTSYTYWFTSNLSTTTILKGNFSVDNLSGSGNNAINRLDSNGKLIRDQIDGYVSGDVFLCFNATAGAYAC